MSALFGTYARSDIAFERGEGMRLYTAEGVEYLDFAAGIGVNALGYSDPHLVAALKAQGEKVWHVSNIFRVPEQERLAERLVEATFADMVFFNNSGAEAVECALKTARRYFFDTGKPERYEFIAFTGSFHGRTLATIAAGGNPTYTKGFGPAVPGFVHAAPGDLASVRALIGPHTAGVIIEPVQGEGGINVMPDAFLKGLRALCDRHGLMLIFDEVQCGYGRTGRFFAHEWAGVAPDLMAVAKGIGGGFPIGACLATNKVGQYMVPGTHGSTFGGNPLACAVGNAVLDRVLAPGFLEHVEEMGRYLVWQLRQLAQRFPQHVVEVRGRGLIAGLKLVPDAKEFVAELRNRRLIAASAGDNVLRLLPPLIVEKADIEEAMGIVASVFEAVGAETGDAA
ncbi:MAG: aspartate aminotransferase family protein [Cucumibacter sp.]